MGVTFSNSKREWGSNFVVHISYEADYGFICDKENVRNLVFELIKLAAENVLGKQIP